MITHAHQPIVFSDAAVAVDMSKVTPDDILVLKSGERTRLVRTQPNFLMSEYHYFCDNGRRFNSLGHSFLRVWDPTDDSQDIVKVISAAAISTPPRMITHTGCQAVTPITTTFWCESLEATVTQVSDSALTTYTYLLNSGLMGLRWVQSVDAEGRNVYDLDNFTVE